MVSWGEYLGVTCRPPPHYQTAELPMALLRVSTTRPAAEPFFRLYAHRPQLLKVHIVCARESVLYDPRERGLPTAVRSPPHNHLSTTPTIESKEGQNRFESNPKRYSK
eukprot:1191057-Prorocentrum_minimum.AAC.7